MIPCMMNIRSLSLAAVFLAGFAQAATAGCYADYKAKKDDPLKLHYGVVELPDNRCTAGAAQRIIAKRVARDGWQLLTVLSVFDENGLAERKASAGKFFLRY